MAIIELVSVRSGDFLLAKQYQPVIGQNFKRNDPVPGGGDEVDGAADAVLHLQQLLELFDPLHGVVGVGRRLGHLTQCACANNSYQMKITVVVNILKL
jgi:hypothetical protein